MHFISLLVLALVAVLVVAMMLQHLENALRRMLENSAWSMADRLKNSIAALMQPFNRSDLTEKEVRAWLVALGKATPR